MKAAVVLLALLMSASAIAEGTVARWKDLADKVDPMSGIPLKDEFTERFLPAASTGDVPALKAILEERKKTLAEEGETAILLYQIGLVHFFLTDRYVMLGLGEEILYHADEAVKVLERAIELGLEAQYLPFAYAYIGASMGARALHVGIIESLFMLVGFDRNVMTAMRLGREFYGPNAPPLSLMYAVRGRRFRDTPWIVGGSPRKAMGYFRRAVELDPGFINNYEDIALTYEKMKENDKAIENWQKVIELPLQERHWKWGVEVKERAEEALKRLRGE